MKKRFQKNRTLFGFTLIELLVVISIIGMLAGLLLPAINSARESGRRSACVSNQKQIALQLIAQADITGFPELAKCIDNPKPSNVVEKDCFQSWIVTILPLLEEQDLAMHIREGNWSIGDTYKIPVLQCKSARITDNKISYVVNGGIACDAITFTGSNVTDSNDYNFNDNIGIDTRYSLFLVDKNGQKIEELKSTSKTLVLSENLNAGIWDEGLFGGLGTDYANCIGILEANFAFTYPLGSSNNPRIVANCASSFSDATVNYINEGGGNEPKNSTARPSSYHPGVVVSSYADGGVRPLSETIDREIFIKLCQPCETNINADVLGW
ncbi:MAG: DUF1559 domain-containing protein [Planctomycetaceae bacterium]|jgi:prepilin-type N-terminal cleavage/methylation domain-containing protein|nr:DUF1559 domain-containing protein [Planctomycetaceae bacterium]